ncbi:motility protein A [Thiomicrorhabdus lithotrophica]|uniref:MotA/TolQ/ExbB proton channel family protein n=1 Tax=Thiomicrorhabdus lithotrophica TaxID=2949997 RepID=A0ABY8CBH9_9GAMM|nr:MotA/TolQ/ExbB proton channel family protein [Thiomicrorhabdus lithotrophica]WEJ63320.1 MotA/TolQ/ExbB proton channel family protein [Thiomicrorhabdus lithotrophica]
MSFSTLIGLVAGIAIVLIAMAMGSSISMFVNIPGLMIVVGGTIAATMIRYSMADSFKAWGMSFSALKVSSEVKDFNELVDITEDLLRLVRAKGLLAMESYELNNSFYNTGVRMLVDGYSVDLVKQTLREKNKLLIEKAETSAGVFRSVGEAAPAFGMIGTLVGLIQMLSNLSDPSAIGPAMAVAMLTTLYGAMIANLVALPIADKIESWAQNESDREILIIEAIDSIGQGHNPAVMRDLLAPFLQASKQVKQSAKEG